MFSLLINTSLGYRVLTRSEFLVATIYPNARVHATNIPIASLGNIPAEGLNSGT